MRFNFFLVVVVFFCQFQFLKANTVTVAQIDSLIINQASDQELVIELSRNDRPNPILHLFKKRQQKKKQVIAALLAFPLPFGIVGLHRIYLGSAPYVPVAYIASLGGMFGVLPLIDFCVLVMNSDTDRYSDNKKIFMWVN